MPQLAVVQNRFSEFNEDEIIPADRKTNKGANGKVEQASVQERNNWLVSFTRNKYCRIRDFMLLEVEIPVLGETELRQGQDFI